VPFGCGRNHFQRDVAEPVLEVDSDAKVRMRKKARGLRAIEKDVLERKDKVSGEAAKGDKVVMRTTPTVNRSQKTSCFPISERSLRNGSWKPWNVESSCVVQHRGRDGRACLRTWRVVTPTTHPLLATVVHQAAVEVDPIHKAGD